MTTHGDRVLHVGDRGFELAEVEFRSEDHGEDHVTARETGRYGTGLPLGVVREKACMVLSRCYPEIVVHLKMLKQYLYDPYDFM